MPRFAYVNGRFVPHRQAAVHIEDRGYQFADGVYEVIAIHNGRLVDEAGHIDRLERSLNEVRMARPMSRRAHALVMRELVRRNGVREGLLYLQVTRGVAPRDFRFPVRSRPSLVMTARHAPVAPAQRLADGVHVATVPDIRWKRRDIKSIALLAQVLAKQDASDRGAFEAWMVDEHGFVTEGSASTAWIVTRDGVLVTRHVNNDILRGVTRESLLRLAAEEGVRVEERPFSVEEAYAAREAFFSSASTYAQPVVQIDDRVIANGKPGSIATRLAEDYIAYAARRNR